MDPTLLCEFVVCALYHLIYLHVVYTCYSNPHRLTSWLQHKSLLINTIVTYRSTLLCMEFFCTEITRIFTSTFLFSLSLSPLLLRNPISLLQSLLFLSPLHLAPFLIPLHGSFPTSTLKTNYAMIIMHVQRFCCIYICVNFAFVVVHDLTSTNAHDVHVFVHA